MPLYIKDDATAELVGQLARRLGVSKQVAVRLAVEAELKRIAEAIPLRQRIAAWRSSHPLPFVTSTSMARIRATASRITDEQLARVRRQIAEAIELG